MIPVPTVPEHELELQTARSSGPGGQNVNKVETKVTLLWDVRQSKALDDAQRRRILERLATRINKDGVLRVTSQKHRSQSANREAARARLDDLVAEAFARRTPRKKTRVPRAAKRRRLEGKRWRSEVKKGRGRIDLD